MFARVVDDGPTLVERLSAAPGASGGDLVDRVELMTRLGMSSEYLAGRLLAQLDDDGDGRVPRAELARKLGELVAGPPEARLRFAFGMHDEDGNGFIDRRELLRMLHISLAENRLAFGDEMVEALTDALFSRADANRDGLIDFDELSRALSSTPHVLEQMSIGDLSWLGVAEPRGASRGAPTLGRSALSQVTWWLLIALYALATAALFVEAFLRYRANGAPLPIQLARGAGAALNMHGALVLLPMCRRTLTALGRTAIGRVLIDDHVAFHRLVGSVGLALGVAHGAAHVVNGALRGASGLVALASWAGITGVVLLVVHLVLWFFARERVRRSGRFEVFYLTHRLYPLWLVLMLVHGPVAWVWMAAPLALFVVDRFLLRRPASTIATDAEVLPSGVTKLTLVRPRAFDHEPGDYVFLCVPALARGEWHPFTISSGAERAGTITLHVRSSGNWTRALHELAVRRDPAEPPIPVLLDGPYGTASAHVFGSRVAVLVAAGIGVTPFASVVETLLERMRKGRDVAVQKVWFVWVCREQQSFEWFTEVLGRLEAEAPDRFDVRIYMDAGRADLKSSVLHVAMDALYASVGADLVTGLRARTILGPPDWDALLSSIAREHPGERVDCYYCGPPGLATKVRAAASRTGLTFRQEHF